MSALPRLSLLFFSTNPDKFWVAKQGKLEDMLIKDMPLMDTLESKIDEESTLCDQEEQKLKDLRETVRELNANFRQLKEERLHPLLQAQHTPSDADVSFSVFSMLEPHRKVDADFEVGPPFFPFHSPPQPSQINWPLFELQIRNDPKFSEIMNPILERLQEIQATTQWMTEGLKEVEKLEIAVVKVARKNGLSKAVELI